MSSSSPTAPLATDPGTPKQRSSIDRLPVVGAGWAALAQGVLLFVPVIVLGQAIGWPASLGDPASALLPEIAANETAVRFGYLAYLGYSVLFGVTMVLLLRLVDAELSAGARRLAVGFAIASVVARCFGIIRWLGPMPVLADSYQAAPGDSERYAVTQVYEALNSYAGTIGEALGVGLFAAASMGLLAIGMLRSQRIPRWLAVGAVIASLAVLVNAVELFGIDLGPALSVTVTLVQLWFLAAGIWLLRRRAAAFA